MLKKFIIQTLETGGVLGVARFLLRNQPRILMYHRIVNDKNLPGINAELFEQQLVYIKNNFNLIGMNELVRRLNNDEGFKNNMVVTFDDGHKDFFQTAWPLLKKHNIPATLFVTTGFVDKNLWLWPDLLRYILLSTKIEHFTVSPLGSFELSPLNALKIWNVFGDYCLTLSNQERIKFLSDLSTQLDVQIEKKPQPPFDAVTWDELRIMHEEGLDVGSHSVSHPILSSLNSQELQQELENSKKRIAAEIGVEPKGICYPNGMARDTSSEVELSAKKYYDYGLVAYPASVDKRKLMHIGRYSASNTMQHFKWLISGISRNKNEHGEYK